MTDSKRRNRPSTRVRVTVRTPGAEVRSGDRFVCIAYIFQPLSTWKLGLYRTRTRPRKRVYFYEYYFFFPVQSSGRTAARVRERGISFITSAAVSTGVFFLILETRSRLISTRIVYGLVTTHVRFSRVFNAHKSLVNNVRRRRKPKSAAVFLQSSRRHEIFVSRRTLHPFRPTVFPYSSRLRSIRSSPWFKSITDRFSTRTEILA